jgi:O-antigen ligase/polysaccharide polymerase Wzy-like membrane protein
MTDSLEILRDFMALLHSSEQLTVWIVGLLALGFFIFWVADPWRALLAWITTFSLQVGASSFHLSLSDLFLVPLVAGAFISYLAHPKIIKPPTALLIFALLFLTIGNLATAFQLGELPQWTWLNKDLGLLALLEPYCAILILCRDRARTEQLLQMFLVSLSVINLVGLLLYAFSVFAGMESRVNSSGMRFRGFLLDPNGYGGLIAVAATFQFAILSMKPKRGLSSALQVLNGCALVAGCVLTLSRGGLIGLLSGGIALLFFTRLKKSFSVALAGVGIAACIFAMSSRQDLLTAARARTDDTGNIESRLDYMEEGVRMYFDSPLTMATGIGIGTFIHRSPRFFGDMHQIHNTYIWLLVEGGPLILIAYLLVLYRALRNSYWIWRRVPDLRYAGAGCFCGLISTIAWCMTVDGMYHHHVWILLAFSELLYQHARSALSLAVPSTTVPALTAHSPGAGSYPAAALHPA